MRKAMEGFEERVNGLAYSPDGTTLATLDHRTIRLWDTANGREKSSIPAGSSSGSLAFHHRRQGRWSSATAPPST